MQIALKAAIITVLRPLVRYLVGQGCTYGILADLLKMTYVGEALRHYASTGGRPPTDSRLTLMTGIHRKEVKRLREMLAEHGMDISLRADASVASRVVALWVSRPDFQTADGQPIPLHIRAAEGPDFEKLTLLTKADMRPRAILDELIRAGVAHLNIADGRVHLLRMAYVSDIPEDKLAFLGRNIGDHLQSAVHNLEQISPFIERALFFDALPIEVLNAIRPELERLGSTLLTQAHEQVSKAEAAETGAAGPARERYRMRFGIYYYEDKLNEDSP